MTWVGLGGAQIEVFLICSKAVSTFAFFFF